MSSSDIVGDRGVREIVLRHFRPDHLVGPELRLRAADRVDAEPLQVRVRRLLADVGSGVDYTPHCDDVGHLPTYPGNCVCHLAYTFVRSDNEPDICIRAAVLRGVRSDNDGEHARTSRQQHAARLDQLPLQNSVRDLHAGVGGGTHQPAHCYDVRYVPAHPGNVRRTGTTYAIRIRNLHATS